MHQEKILNGKAVAAGLNERLIQEISVLKSKNIKPALTVIIVGEDPASKVYVRRKQKASEKLGIISDTIYLPEDTHQEKLLDEIRRLNNTPSINGILVQLPLPSHIDEQTIIEAIDPQKDVDCFHPHNIGLLSIGKPYVLPCTPGGILEILKFYNISTQGKHVVVAGRSNIVGKPMASLLIQKNDNANATVTVVHSRTQNMMQICRQADILIAAIGKPLFFNRDFIKGGAVIIDVGINRVDDPDRNKGYRLTGDVDFDDVVQHVSYITPVPGGVGPMTIAMLMRNTLVAAARQNNQFLSL